MSNTQESPAHNRQVQQQTLHPSTYQYLQPTDEQVGLLGVLREAAATYSATLDQLLPPGPDKTFVLRQLRGLAMWVNVAVTRNADGSPRQ
jgi:hypothetical protein